MVALELDFPLIHPNSKFKSFWMGIFMISMVYTVSLMPYVTCFY